MILLGLAATALSLPSYVESSGIMNAPVEHNWDDSDPMAAYAWLDERLQHRIGAISHRGRLAVSAGFAEWIAFRLKPFCSDPLLFHKIEAIYAGIVDWRYMSSQALPSRRDYLGATRAPLWEAAKLIDKMVDLTKRKQFATPESVCLSFLALHVIPNPKPFKDWRRFAIGRLTTLYPLDRDIPLGPPVPRDALNPDLDYKPEMAHQLLSKFLKSLDPRTNPYLRSAPEMIAAGFEGTPYSL